LAVAPFDVLDPPLSLWREGLVDVLSRNLDGAGPIRTVPPTLVVRRWRGRADPASAAELGRRTGARLAVYGQLVSIGPDSVRLKATLLDVSNGRTIAEVERNDQTARLNRLADSLTVALLRELGRTRPIGAFRLESLGSGSLPAIKAFLQGEQFFRRTAWDSATAYYERALAQDSGLALAYHRMGTALGWARIGGDALSRAALLRAGALNHGLGVRDSLLLLADSLSGAAYGYEGGLEWLRQVRRLLATLEETTRRYPDDPEAWYALGDARFHFGLAPGVYMTHRQQLEAFDRSIALDSAFGPAYIHPAAIALMMSDAVKARRYADTYSGLPNDAEGSGIRLVALLLDPTRARAAETQRLLDTASAEFLANARVAMRDWPDSAETQVRLSRLLAAGRHGSFRLYTDTVAQRVQLARMLTRRGHLHEAYETYRAAGRADPALFADLALLGGIPQDTAAIEFARWLRAGLSPAVFAIPWWTARGDTASLATLARRADSTARLGSSAADRERARYGTVAIRAFLALARRDTSEALRLFVGAPDTLCGNCDWIDMRQKAALLAARGRDKEAAALLEFTPVYFSNLDSQLRALERGRVYERLGDRARAIEAYGFVTDVWRNADPELQPLVEEARTALRRLGREPRPTSSVSR
jgi:serine/threonine-protein kinase